MTTKHVVTASLLSCLVTLLVLFTVLFVAGPAAADGVLSRAPGAPAASTTTAYWNIAGSTFLPMYEDTDAHFGSGGCTYSLSSYAVDAEWNAPVTLPSGSTITAVRFQYKDLSPAENSYLHLVALDDANGYHFLATLASSGDSGLGFQTATGLSHLVDYSSYRYILFYNAYLVGTDMQLCGVRIEYTMPNILAVALPNVAR